MDKVRYVEGGPFLNPLRNGQYQCCDCSAILGTARAYLHRCEQPEEVESCDHGTPMNQPCAGCIIMPAGYEYEAVPDLEERYDRNSRSYLLDEASALIDGQRAQDYGDAAENFGRIAAGWSEIIQHSVTPAQVALCMDWLKTCRLITSPGHRDSWIDKAGYTALGGEIALS